MTESPTETITETITDAAAVDASTAGPGPVAAGDSGPPLPPEQPPGEIGGPGGPEPTRFGDWERKGRCSDF